MSSFVGSVGLGLIDERAGFELKSVGDWCEALSGGDNEGVTIRAGRLMAALYGIFITTLVCIPPFCSSAKREYPSEV